MSSRARTPLAASPKVLVTPATRTTGATAIPAACAGGAATGAATAGAATAGAADSVTGGSWASGTGDRPVAVPGEQRLGQPHQGDEPEPERRAHDDRGPQALRARRV